MIEGFASLEELSRLVVQAALNGVWQSVPVTLAVATAMVFLRRKSAATRHLIWSATLLIVVTLPIAAAGLAGVGTERAVAPAGVAVSAHVAEGETVPRAAGDAAAHQPGVAGLIELPGGAWLVPLLGLGVLVACVRLARLLLSLRRVRSLKRASHPLAPGCGDRLRALRDRHVGKRVELRVSDRITTPLTLGFLHPVVLLPNGLVEDLSEGELAQVTLHELAHIRRHDHWSNLAQRAIEAVFFFHPVVLWIGKRLELERELACDEYTVANSGGERAYARCLTRLAELAMTSRETQLAPGAVSRGSQLSRRVQALLAPDRPAIVRPCIATSATFAAGVIAASFALAHAAPVLGIRAVPRPPLPRPAASSALVESAPAAPSIGVSDENRSDRALPPRSGIEVVAEARAAEETAEPAGSLEQPAAPRRTRATTDRLPAPTVVAGTAAGTQWALHGSSPDIRRADAPGEQPGCAVGAGADECTMLATALSAAQEQPLATADAEELAPAETDAPDASTDTTATSNRNGGRIRIDIAVAVPFLPRARPVRAMGRPYGESMPAVDYNTPVGDMIDAIRGGRSGAGRVGGIRLSIRGNGAPGGRGVRSVGPW